MSNEHRDDHEPQSGRDVTISIDGKSFTIHRGRTTVAEIKGLGSVPVAYDLEQVIDGKLVPLPDDSAITLKGGEVFVSHPKDASSS